MGLPALSIPNELLTALRHVLEGTGAVVRVETPSEGDSEGLVSTYVCVSAFNGIVRVYILKARRSGPFDFIAVLNPSSPSILTARASNDLLKKIDKVLRQNGAAGVVPGCNAARAG